MQPQTTVCNEEQTNAVEEGYRQLQISDKPVMPSVD